MNKLAFLDETLDLNLTKTYHISIQASLNGFSFCVLDTVQNKYVALKHYPIRESLPTEDWVKEIERILKEDDFLNKDYNSVSFMEVSGKSTLIPAALFDKNNLKLYLEFNTYIDELDEIHFNKIDKTDVYNVFTTNTYLASSLKTHFPNLEFYHQTSSFLNHFGSLSKTNNSQQIFINVNYDFIDIAVWGKSKLLLNTNMPYRKESEITYLILNVYQQLKLSRENTELKISGFINKNASVINDLKKYIRQVRFSKQSESFSYSYTFTPIEGHQFLNLLNLYKCE